MVINYPSLGEVPPRPSLLVQGPDLLLLLLSRSPQEAPAWKKALFKPVFPEGDDALHQSQPSRSSPVVRGRKVWGGHTGRVEVAGTGWDGAVWEGKSRDLCASQPCIPVLGNCQSLAAQPGSSPAISNVPLGPVTSRRAGEMTSRGGQQQPGAR